VAVQARHEAHVAWRREHLGTAAFHEPRGRDLDRLGVAGKRGARDGEAHRPFLVGRHLHGVRRNGTVRGGGCRAEHELASYFPAVRNGNVHFGVAKELARLAWDGRAFAVRRDDGDVLLDAVTHATGPWTAARAGGPPGFEAMRAVFACPVVGRKGDGRYVRSAFGWDFADAVEVRGMLWKVAWPSAASL